MFNCGALDYNEGVFFTGDCAEVKLWEKRLLLRQRGIGYWKILGCEVMRYGDYDY